LTDEPIPVSIPVTLRDAFPRLCALAEVLWSSGDRDFPDFERRLLKHLERLEAIGVEYRRNDGPLPWQMRPGVQGRPRDRIRLGEPPLPSAPIQT
jgi:hypothetical protein